MFCVEECLCVLIPIILLITSRVESFCTAVGRFPDPSVAGCVSFTSCSIVSGVLAETKMTCTNGTRFDPIANSCSSTYKCAGECKTVGRFVSADANDCVGYILCVAKEDETLVKYELRCSGNVQFDPSDQMCSPNYVCPG